MLQKSAFLRACLARPSARPIIAALLAAAASAGPLQCAQAQTLPADPVAVRVEQRGDLVVVDVDATVAAPSATVWSVLTDYDHMAQFLSALKASKITSRQDNTLEVEQSGEARHGFLHFSFYTLRKIEETPNVEIRSHLIKGDFKSYELTTKIVDQGATTVIHQHGEYIPNTWVPPGVGPAAIKSETEKGFGEIIAEIMKRAH